jgi:LemA protein
MLKEKDNSVRTAWINMDRQYQYRNDMILNLVDMVGSEIPQEKDVLQTALAVHDRASKVQASMDNPTPEMLEAYLNVQDSVRYALGYLLFEAAKIPALKEDYGLFVFQEQLKGLEKRIGL